MNQDWQKEEDAEPHRVQLRSSWNTWEQYIGSYEDLLLWEFLGESEQEGRKVNRYNISLDPQKSPPKKNLSVKTLSGSVSIDQATAVRIYSEVRLVLVRENYEKVIRFALKRYDIKKDFSIDAPQ